MISDLERAMGATVVGGLADFFFIPDAVLSFGLGIPTEGLVLTLSMLKSEAASALGAWHLEVPLVSGLKIQPELVLGGGRGGHLDPKGSRKGFGALLGELHGARFIGRGTGKFAALIQNQRLDGSTTKLAGGV